MKILRVRHKALVTGYPPSLKEKLTFNVKDFNDNVVVIRAYEESKEGLWIPRCLVSAPVEDANWERVEIAFTGELRPHQKRYVEEFLKAGSGIIAAGMGSGKTVMALYLAHKLGLKTLVVVPTETLFLQWIQRVKEFCGFYPTTIRGNHCDTSAPIVIGMLKTLALGTKIDRESLYKTFGFVVYDEVHRVGAPLYNIVSGMFWDKHRLGLSGTVSRRDGLHNLFIWNIGNVISLGPQALQTPKPLVYIIKYIDYDYIGRDLYTYSGKFNLPKFLNRLAKAERRNKLILTYIVKAYKKGKKILVLSDRLDQLRIIARALKSLKITDVGFLTGSEKDIDHDIILATYGAGSEGFDLPELDCLIFGTPRADVRQALGRVLRPKEKRPIVIDIVDMTTEAKYFFYSRIKTYRALSCEIKEVVIDRGGVENAFQALLQKA